MVRIWRLPVEILDRQHLLGEHNELGIIHNAYVREYVLTNKFPSFYKFLFNNGIRIAWINHPQAKHFRGHIGQLVDRHNQQVAEMKYRGYNHNSPLLPLPFVPEFYEYTKEEHKEDLALLESRGGTKK